MGSSSSKAKLITKPCQSGKDYSITQLIINAKHTAEIYGLSDMITIIFHGNSKALGNQKSARMSSDSEHFNPSEILLWNSDGTSSSDILDSGIRQTNGSYADVWSLCEDGDVKYILCCDNMSRFRNVSQLLTKASRFMDKYDFPGFRIVIDEADDRNNWHSFASFSESCNAIKEIYLVTATPEKLIKKYGQMVIAIQREPIVKGLYVSSKNQEWQLYDFLSSSALDYIKQVFDKPDVNQWFVPGSKWFVPGDVKRKSHRDVAAFFLEKGASVVILNGMEKKIVLSNGDEYDIADEIKSGHQEVGQIIKNYWVSDERLQAAPIVITGNLCVERGISFQDSREGVFLFDVAIVSYIPEKSKAYQMISRMFGNFMRVRDGHYGIICTTTTMKTNTHIYEELAISLNEVSEEYDESEEKIVTKSDIHNLKKGFSPQTMFCYEFELFQKAAEICEYHGHRVSEKGREMAPVDKIHQYGNIYRAPFVDCIWMSRDKYFRNPTFEEVKAKYPGVNEKRTCRVLPLNNGNWVAYGIKKYIY
jgi:hypothetical protein